MPKIHIYSDGFIFYASDDNTTALKGTEEPSLTVEDTEENRTKYLSQDQINTINQLNNVIQSNQR